LAYNLDFVPFLSIFLSISVKNYSISPVWFRN